MPSKHFHHELGKVAHDLDVLSIPFTENDVDEIWKKIINDVHQYRSIDKFSPRYQEPPIQDFSIEQSDQPDIIYQCDNYIMGIEHFEFDASKKTKKGSKQKQKQAEADRAIYEEYRRSNQPKIGITSIQKPVDVNFSIADYLETLKSNFMIHARSIPDYRKKLAEKGNGKRVMLTFFIEDTTAIGNYVVRDDESEALDPLKLRAFLELLASSNGLDYVIIKTTDMYVPRLRIQRITKSSIVQLLNECYSSDYKYLPYHYIRQNDFL